MYLQNFISDKGAVIDAAMRHPALNPKRHPTIEQALKVVVSEIEREAIANIQGVIRPELADMYDMYELNNGEYGDIGVDDREDWESGLDDQVEMIVQPYEQHLSADWLARNTIDTRLYEDGALDKLAQSCAREIVKQLCAVSTDEMKMGLKEKSPAQILANAGIVTSDVTVYLEQHLASKTPEQEKAMADEASNAVGDVLSKVREHIGTGFDMAVVTADLELAIDDDDILAYGAGARLGLEEDDVEVLRAVVFEHGGDTLNVLVSALSDTKKEKPKRAKADKAADAAPAMDGGNAVLKLLKDHSAVNDTKLAADLGFSRATFNNYLAGKSEFKADEIQKEILRSTVLETLNGMYEALCMIDGVDVDRTFE